MNCKNCGFTLVDGAQFCGNCGTPVACVQQTSAPPLPVEQTPQYASPAPQYETPAPQYGTPAPQYGTPAPQYYAPQPVRLVMKPNFTFSSYSFNVYDAYGNYLYKAENANTAFSYGAHVVDVNGYELLRLKQASRASFMTMKFDMFRGNQFISQVNQEVSGSHYNYVLPELGIVAQGDTFAVDTNIYRNNQLIAVTSRNKAFSDQYDVTLYDPQVADIVMIIVVAMQTCIGKSRRR